MLKQKTNLVFLVCILTVAAGTQAEKLKIATFNCEFLTRPKVHIKFGEDFRFDGWTDTFRDQQFAIAAEAVAEVIADIDADIIALTEVGKEEDVEELRLAVANQGVDYPHMAFGKSTDTSTRQNVAILSKLPLFGVLQQIPGRESYDKELDDPETEADTGISKGMVAEFEFEGETFTLYVLHLKSEAGGHEADAQRVAQASVVRRHYLPGLHDGQHIIVAGDLNDYRGQPAIRRIRGRDDIFADLIQTGLAKYFDDDELDTRWTYEFMGQRNQIDHILLSLSIKDVTDDIAAEVFDHGNPLASDHRALVVTLEMD